MPRLSLRWVFFFDVKFIVKTTIKCVSLHACLILSPATLVTRWKFSLVLHIIMRNSLAIFFNLPLSWFNKTKVWTLLFTWLNRVFLFGQPSNLSSIRSANLWNKRDLILPQWRQLIFHSVYWRRVSHFFSQHHLVVVHCIVSLLFVWSYLLL